MSPDVMSNLAQFIEKWLEISLIPHCNNTLLHIGGYDAELSKDRLPFWHSQFLILELLLTKCIGYYSFGYTHKCVCKHFWLVAIHNNNWGSTQLCAEQWFLLLSLSMGHMTLNSCILLDVHKLFVSIWSHDMFFVHSLANHFLFWLPQTHD